MLSKKFRLPGNQIPLVLKKGKRFSFPLFNLVVCQQSQLLNSRFTFVVSTKISKKAVVRNRTKRLLSEAVRLLLPQIKKGFDIIFFAKKPFLEEKLQDVMPQVEKALNKIKLLISS
ncbi:ribonuclease P protein component [Candidatus Microgenomates bacterium]|nr:ribonuclease P protein component [Candidatus Microgenomates bacterium]